ncbi:MAG TPA: HigA family addiction module antitoxin [Tepidisphaeraceae bacterium]|nr:HigA family addiction module antitoxin [Tepidisphaeraceae bacterium]
MIKTVVTTTIKLSGDFPIAVHPGGILKEFLDDRGVTQSQLARHLQTDVARINEICNRRRGVSAAMAVQFARAFGTSASLWANLQTNWELSTVNTKRLPRIGRIRVSA